MAKITVAGASHEIPVMNFKALKKIWPIMDKLKDEGDLMVILDSSISIIAIAMVSGENPKIPDEDVQVKVDWLNDNLTSPESKEIQQVLKDVLTDSGYFAGNVQPEVVTPPVPVVESSTETTTELLPS